MSALAIGLIAGVVCYLMVAQVKGRVGYDDSLDAFGVHGVGGTIGAILTGVFASRAINPIFKDGHGSATGLSIIDGNAGQLLNQFVGVVIGWLLAVVGTLVILKVVDLTIGLRVPEDHEIQGLDLSQHGEEGYNFEVSA
jgi:Amt family ammonium transporter